MKQEYYLWAIKNEHGEYATMADGDPLLAMNPSDLRDWWKENDRVVPVVVTVEDAP